MLLQSRSLFASQAFTITSNHAFAYLNRYNSILHNDFEPHLMTPLPNAKEGLRFVRSVRPAFLSMSTLVQSEPPTNGKVVLNTTLGALDIELWSKEAPKATRNFVQLCLDGFYNQCHFFRVIPRFIAQTGDPTNSGDGPQRTYLPDDATFPNEIHSRLRFRRMGLVCCAGTPSDPSLNANQFFITLEKTPELEKKHTIFGKIVGDSIYNLITVNEMTLERGTEDRLAEPPIILSSDVVWNPFDDIYPRESAAQRAALEADKEPSKPKSAARAIKNFGLLSFGDEAEEDEVVFKSTTEKVTVAPSKTKSRPKMTNPEDDEEERAPQTLRQNVARNAADDEDVEWQIQMESKSRLWNVAEKKADRRDERIEARKEAKRKAMRGKTESDSDEDSKDEDGKPTYRNRKGDFVETIDAPKLKKRKLAEDEDESEVPYSKAERHASSTAESRAPTTAAPSKASVNEDSILAKLAAFKSKISLDKAKPTKSEDDDWRATPLVFDASLESEGDMRRDMKRDDYVVIDPSEERRDASQRSPEHSRRSDYDRRDDRNDRRTRDYSPRDRRRDDSREYRSRGSPDRRESEYRSGNHRSSNHSQHYDSRRRNEDEGRRGGSDKYDDRDRRPSPPRSRYNQDSRRNDRY